MFFLAKYVFFYKINLFWNIKEGFPSSDSKISFPWNQLQEEEDSQVGSY